MRGRVSPLDIVKATGKNLYPVGFVYTRPGRAFPENSPTTVRLMEVNDKPTKVPHREEDITERFSLLGVHVTFEG